MTKQHDKRWGWDCLFLIEEGGEGEDRLLRFWIMNCAVCVLILKYSARSDRKFRKILERWMPLRRWEWRGWWWRKIWRLYVPWWPNTWNYSDRRLGCQHLPLSPLYVTVYSPCNGRKSFKSESHDSLYGAHYWHQPERIEILVQAEVQVAESWL